MVIVTHQAEQHQFIYQQEGEQAHLRYRHLDADTVEAFNTYVPPALRNAGVADKLARAFYQWTRSQSLTIVPSCSYIEVWLSRHGE